MCAPSWTGWTPSAWSTWGLGTPQAGGRVPRPWSLPPETLNVPTYYAHADSNPETAQNQLDHAFASRGFHDSVKVCALNSVEEWGASDHCRLRIEVAGE